MLTRITTTLLALLFATTALAQNIYIDISWEEYNVNRYVAYRFERKLKYIAKPDSVLNGRFRWASSNGWTEEFEVRNNLFEGICKRYYKGALREETNYKGGKVNGKRYLYHDARDEEGRLVNGPLYRELNYKNGIEVDTSFVIDRDRWLIELECLNKKGERHGLYAKFYPEMKFQDRRHYSNGKPVGDWINYYKDGNIRELYKYSKDGNKVDTYKYHPDGKLKFESHIENSIYIGVYKTVSKEGKVQSEYQYTNGWERGKQMRISNYLYPETYTINKNGKMNGKYRQTDMQGNKRVEGKFSKGMKVGTWKFYTATGDLLEEVQFSEGESDRMKDGKMGFLPKERSVLKSNQDYYVPINNEPQYIKEVETTKPQLFLFSE